ncbi:Protein translocase subunit SecA 1 [Ananas comosus]|uniref:Protein translocase subunit SecA 1 n=1 Tax=Ananas comosus TaxID=4615 RepID=A0A199UQZ8_ANACO|nr:Protein translocase subunit SecA 1 [Ananas comosus]
MAIISRSLRTLINLSHPPLSRSISSTPRLNSLGWFDKIKGAITGKPSPDPSKTTSFSLIDFANQMDKARKLGSFKNFVAGRCSEATISDAFEKHSEILRYLGSIDPTGESLQNSHKIDATKHCNCTITEVEHILAKYSWAKEAQKKIEKLKEEGKPLPKSFSEVQKLMGSTPLEVGRSNLAKSGQISRNALCPCGSGKRYKRCAVEQAEVDKRQAHFHIIGQKFASHDFASGLMAKLVLN